MAEENVKVHPIPSEGIQCIPDPPAIVNARDPHQKQGRFDQVLPARVSLLGTGICVVMTVVNVRTLKGATEVGAGVGAGVDEYGTELLPASLLSVLDPITSANSDGMAALSRDWPSTYPSWTCV